MAAIHDFLLFPHCDLHVVRTANPASGPQLFLRAAVRDSDDATQPTVMPITEVLPLPSSGNPGGSFCTFAFFEPHAPIGQRFGSGATGLPSVHPFTGLVTAPKAGIFLFQAEFNGHAMIGRLQVHESILGWWFGNSSITTALDPQIAHAQPSIYALFSDDPTGADRVGDITGHGYVTLTSANTAIATVDTYGRLQGHAEGTTELNGSFLGANAALPVRVVRYDKIRNTLEPVHLGNATHPLDAHNMIFLAEGFPAAKKALFDEIVRKVVDDLFDNPRHEPYGMLAGSFNAWKVFEASQQPVLTCGFTVNTSPITMPHDGTIVEGCPVPYPYHTKDSKTGKYTVEELVRIVGLPRRNEPANTGVLVDRWQHESLYDPTSADGLIQSGKIDDDLIAAWKGQRTEALLEARDTFYGLELGWRLADRTSAGAVTVPPADGPPAALPNPIATFVAQLYSFFDVEPPRATLPDPRRHPPQLLRHRWSDNNPGSAIMRYLNGLEWTRTPGLAIGSEVVPDPAVFKRSRGLVALIAYEGLYGGANFCNLTITGVTVNGLSHLAFSPPSAGNTRVMRRMPPADLKVSYHDRIGTIAHEFGHSFNLDDEYEEHPNPPLTHALTDDIEFDNVTHLGAVYFNGTVPPNANFVTNLDGTIDPAKIKWASLPRMMLSARLIRDSEPSDGGLKVTIDRGYIGDWLRARDQPLHPSLRNFTVTARGKQLPLATGTAFLTNLTIGHIDPTAGTIVLSGAPGAGTFVAGSVLFVPKPGPNPGDPPMVLMKPPVRTQMASSHRALNVNTDTTQVNKQPDLPVTIPNFNAPCNPYRLIGLYEGAVHHTSGYYRPAGLCKMRSENKTPTQDGEEGVGDGEFCHVCKWLIVNRVDPGKHTTLDHHYPGDHKKK